MWFKISSLEEINLEDIAFKEWTWEAIGMLLENFLTCFRNSRLDFNAQIFKLFVFVITFF